MCPWPLPPPGVQILAIFITPSDNRSNNEALSYARRHHLYNIIALSVLFHQKAIKGGLMSQLYFVAAAKASGVTPFNQSIIWHQWSLSPNGGGGKGRRGVVQKASWFTAQEASIYVIQNHFQVAQKESLYPNYARDHSSRGKSEVPGPDESKPWNDKEGFRQKFKSLAGKQLI